MRNPQEYFVLLAPAVTFLLVLGSRQARISIIARDNTRQIIEVKRRNEDQDRERADNLVAQNKTLLIRYHLIQWALIVLCLGLLILGVEAFYEYFYREQVVFWTGVFAMGLGTISILREIMTGADTLRHEIDFAEWYQPGSKKGDVPRMVSCALLKPRKRRKTA